MTKILETTERFALYTIVFLLPFSFLTIFPNPYETPKILLLTGGLVLVLAIRAVRLLLRNENSELSIGSFDVGVIILALAYLVSAILRTPNKMEAFFLPGTATVFVAAAILYFLLNQIPNQSKNLVSIWLFLSGLVSSLFFLLAFLGILAKIPQLPNFVKDPYFTPIGGIFSLAIFLAITVPLGVSLILKQEKLANKLFLGVGTLVIVLGLTLAVFNLLPGKASSPTLPNWPASWAVAVETLKESPIVGMGPGNYLTAFNRFLPLTYNQTQTWAVRFTTGSDFFLTVMTEAGLLSIVALALIIFTLIKRISSVEKNIESLGFAASISLLLVLMFIFPATTVEIVAFFILLSLFSSEKKVSLVSGTGRILAVIAVVFLAVVSFQAVKIADADIVFGKSLAAISSNNGSLTYNLMASAINKNPQVDRYHAIFAQINLALARNLAQNPSAGQGKPLTDTEKQNISQLIQQAIAEGKAAVTLNPQRSGNWEILGAIYQAIMPLAQGADQFTVQAMSQAVALDPVNPNLRIELGGVYYALGQYDNAIDTFKLAALAKNDLANAHYNLSAAYREKKDFDNAISEMNIVLSLVKKDSQDYQQAKTELDNLQKSKTAKSTGTESLIPPQKAEAQIIKPPLELPKEATPPAAQ